MLVLGVLGQLPDVVPSARSGAWRCARPPEARPGARQTPIGPRHAVLTYSRSRCPLRPEVKRGGVRAGGGTGSPARTGEQSRRRPARGAWWCAEIQKHRGVASRHAENALPSCLRLWALLCRLPPGSLLGALSTIAAARPRARALRRECKVAKPRSFALPTAQHRQLSRTISRAGSTAGSTAGSERRKSGGEL